MQALLDSLKAKFPDAILATRTDAARAETAVSVAAAHLSEIARYLHDAPEAAFDHLTDICSVDYPEDQMRFEVVYHLHSLPLRQRLRLKARLTEDDPTIASVTGVWKGAEFLEREVYDMMGIRFSGHPDLRRILMPEDYDEGYPLRKDFPTEGRGWRSKFEFIPRLDEASVNVIESEFSEEQKSVFRAEPDVPISQRKEELLLNMGPQHPSTHGVLRVVLMLDGERVVKATPDLGYLHRGVEKLCEGLTYMQIIPHTDRLDYVCAMSNNYAYVRAVEKLLEIEVPIRAEYIRTLVAEMQRIIGHLFWLGTQALDIGAMTVFFWTFRERETLLDMFEKLCGARLTLNYYRIGGVDSDFTPELVQRMKAFLETFPEKVKEYDSLIASNRIWLGRTKNIAVLSAEDAISFGCTGPVLRGSGVAYDVRKVEPYGVYDKVDWEVPIGKNGRHLRSVLDPHGRNASERQDHRTMPRSAAGGADHGRGAAIYPAAQGTGHAGHGKPDPPFHHLHPGYQATEGRNLLCDGGPEGRVGILYRQRRQPSPLPTEDSRAVVRPYGRFRPHGTGLPDFRHHHDLRDLRCRNGGM